MRLGRACEAQLREGWRPSLFLQTQLLWRRLPYIAVGEMGLLPGAMLHAIRSAKVGAAPGKPPGRCRLRSGDSQCARACVAHA